MLGFVIGAGFEPARFCITDFRGVIFVLVSFRQPSFDATNHTCYRHNPFSRPTLPFRHPIKKTFCRLPTEYSYVINPQHVLCSFEQRFEYQSANSVRWNRTITMVAQTQPHHECPQLLFAFNRKITSKNLSGGGDSNSHYKRYWCTFPVIDLHSFERVPYHSVTPA